MINNMNNTFDKTVQQQFEEEGYTLLKDVLEPSTVEEARAEMKQLVDDIADKLMADGKISDPMKDAPFETRLAQLFQDHPNEAPKSFRTELHLPELFPVFFNSRIIDIAESLLGPEIRLYPNYTARPKLPDHAATVVLWHQDGGYTEAVEGAQGQVDVLRMMNVWSPLVPARVENGCMQFVPGTHKLGVVPHIAKEHYLEISPEYLQPREAQAINVEMDPGDVVLFHNLLFHRGLPNRSATIRWSLDWRYQDATQPTLRQHQGHIARSRRNPESAVPSAQAWADLSFI